MRFVFLLAFLAAGLTSAAAEAAPFCLWHAPWGKDMQGKPDRWLNLTVVQYVDVTDNDVHIVFGGGNLGSGHDLHIQVKNRDEAQKVLKDLNDTAKACDRDERN
ncbi:hypothetical protein HNQ50_001951 [Silvimonas terrae]|uniref:Uncharacterized protein n=1 Tax=Silvimonas terrae TaxID=300266 RepID=A0A840RFD7_9NEIS|nr:hypothetical protein [Silvimonas terrae]MBB5191228.1 hypothetical protein [Silvimonas terrae]